MWPAFPTSDYYGSSAPPRQHQPTTDLPTGQLAADRVRDHRDGSHVHLATVRRDRHPTMPLQHRRGYAADLHHGLPTGDITQPRSSPQPQITGTRCYPAQIRQIRAGGQLLRGFQPLVPHVYLSVLLAGPGPSGSAGPSRRCQGCLPPSPPSRGSGCPQLQPARCDGPEAVSFHHRTVKRRLVALDIPAVDLPRCGGLQLRDRPRRVRGLPATVFDLRILGQNRSTWWRSSTGRSPRLAASRRSASVVCRRTVRR